MNGQLADEIYEAARIDWRDSHSDYWCSPPATITQDRKTLRRITHYEARLDLVTDILNGD